MNDNENMDMNDIEKKLFEGAVKKAEADPELDFFKDFDPELPPVSSFMVDNPEGKPADEALEETLDAESMKEADRSKRKNRRMVFTIAPIAACLCIAFVVLFQVGPNNLNTSSGGASMSPESVADAKSISWETAGENYTNLFNKIEEYQSMLSLNAPDDDESRVMTMADAMPAMGVDTGSPEAPSAAAEAPEFVATENETGGGTAGSGYQDFEGAELPPATEVNDVVTEEMPVEQVPDEAAPDFSDTNEQVVGVREADIVKTDGKYIYAINSNNLSIVDVSGEEMSVVSKIPQPTVSDGQVYFEMYLAGDRIIAIRHGYNMAALARMESPEDEVRNEEGTAGSGYPDKPMSIIYPIGGYFTDTSVDIFDISDKSDPKLVHSLSQSGDYRESRMVDGNLYLLTNYYGGDVSQIDKNDPRTYVPLYVEDGAQLLPAPEEIILPGGETWPAFTLISGIDATGSGKFVSKKSVYGESSTVYCSTQSVYVTRTEYTNEEMPAGEFVKYFSSMCTVITKADLNNGDIEIVAVESVPGTTLNQFSLDEYNGVLRLVTTNDQSTWYDFRNYSTGQAYDWTRLPESTFTTSNALYTLDSSLKILGKVENLARDERVFSCRFMGDFAYFVTFRQTDPLFSVDLSDPSNPTVLDALKIPGFSEYLHPYGEGELFGLGRDADPETGLRKGIKLTMFDNSNPADLKEKTTLLVANQDSFSSAETNHKAILINKEKSIIAFPIQQWEDAGPLSRYMIYTYDEIAGFAKVAEITIDTGEMYSFSELRGLFIGDTFYVVGPNNIGAYAMNADAEAFAEKQILQIDENAYSVNRYSYYPPGTIMPFIQPAVGVFEDEIIE